MPASPPPTPRPQRPRSLRAQADAGSLKQGPVLRLLPAVIMAAVFMLGFRIQVVVRDLTNVGETTSVALTPGTALAAAPADASAAVPAEGGAGAEVTDASAPPLPINFDPSTLTTSEIDTLQRLAERRDMITQRERELEAKEGLLQAAEGRIDGKIAQLQDLEKNIQGLLTQYDAQKQAEIDQLVKIYGAMKPAEAARIFDTLEMPILVSVIQKMKETKVAPIMARMAPEKATALTEELSSRRQLPTAGGPPA
jgi:flagellar motility protein MotE (MotC chaperone)